MGAVTVSETLLRPTEQTTDWPDAVPPVGFTSNHAYARSFELVLVASSGEFELDAEQSTADPLLLRLFQFPSAAQALPDIEHARIDNLGEAGYCIPQPIPVEIRRVGIGDFEASFREANIAISGSDSDDAYQALVAEILDTFDGLTEDKNLGISAAEQLRILKTYIVRT
jgi:hypothetical protein